MLKLTVAGGVAAMALLMAIGSGSDRPPLRSPFPRAETIAAVPSAGAAKARCPTTPAAVRDIVTVSKFGENRREHDSTITDDEADEAYAADTRAVTTYSRRVAAMADSFSQRSASGVRDARCALAWMNDWAEQDALLGRVNPTGEAVRKWELATLASAYLKLRSAPLDRDQTARVRRWLGRIGQAVKADYSRNLGQDSRTNNHVNWAAWAVMTAAIADDDRELFDWSMARFHQALGQVAADGSLPLELKRRQLAASYHNYALAPLVMLREGAIANGAPLSPDDEARLGRLADLMLDTLADPGELAARTGYEQDMGKITATHLAWLEPWYARGRDPRALALLERYRPLSFSRLGGNLTVQFGVALAGVRQPSPPAGGGSAGARADRAARP